MKAVLRIELVVHDPEQMPESQDIEEILQSFSEHVAREWNANVEARLVDYDESA